MLIYILYRFHYMAELVKSMIIVRTSFAPIHNTPKAHKEKAMFCKD